MAILVTGAAGFIGFHTARALLARGEPVIGIDNLDPYYDPALKQARLDRLGREFGGAFSFHRLDFADQSALATALGEADFDRIVHLGAQVGVRYSVENPAAYVRSNLVGHCNILELARARNCAHLVYASSSSVYGRNRELPFATGQRTDQPVSLYAATKKANELLSESYASLYRLPMTGLRFFTVYGPWGRPDMALWLFTKAILAGEPLKLFNGGEMRRDFTFIDDALRGVLACLDSPPADDGKPKAGGSLSPHAVYNIGNHRSEPLTRFITVLEQALGRRAVIQSEPMQPGDVPDTFADIDDIGRDLGFAPRVSIDEGIPKFVDWYREYYSLDR